MNKKLIAAAAAAMMVLSIGSTALAADGDTITSPKGTAAGEGIVASTGSATATGNDNIQSIVGDDDALAGTNDTGDADINLWGRISGGSEGADKVYKLDVAWGDMYFVYIFNGGSWNPDTYTYTEAGGGRWNEQFVNGRNNRITVTNHSNDSVDATFAYAMAPGKNGEGTIFNAPPTQGATSNLSRVVGNFFKYNNDAYNALRRDTYVSDALDAEPEVFDGELIDSTLKLQTADAYNEEQNPTDDSKNHPADARAEEVFFTFSGVPDRYADLGKTFVGTVTITFAPGTLASYPLYNG